MLSFIIQRLKGDKIIWLIIFMISMLSLLAVYSAAGSPMLKGKGSTEYYLIRHASLLLLGFGVMFFVTYFDYRIFAKISNLLLYLSVPLLLYTLVLGQEVNSASRWISLFGQSFQPSDFAKVALLVYLAKVLTEKQDVIKDFRQTFVPVISWVLIICGLIAPANLSTAMLLFTTSLVLMFIAGVHIKYLGGFILIGLVCLFILFKLAPRHTVWENRMEDYWLTLTDPAHEPHDQVIYSNAAIASGDLLGKGAGKGVEKYYIANSVSDMIYPVIILEYGSLFGGLITILLYLGLLFRGVGIATVSKTFGALLAAALSFMLAFQAMINMGVSVGLLPVTGLQLPMLSMGGTSIIFTGLALGIILSVSRHAIENGDNKGEEAA